MRHLPLFPEEPRPLLFAHRGYSARAPENTLSAFREASRAGIPGVELDIHRCATGELVVAHDSDLFRVTGEHAEIETAPLSRIRELDAAVSFRRKTQSQIAAEPAPLLSELFDQFGARFYYDIEIKHYTDKPGTVELALSELIGRFGLDARCMVSSFDPFAVRRFKQLNPRIPTAIIYCDDPELPFWLRRGGGRYISSCDVMKPKDASVTARLLRRRIVAPRLPVVSWTVDSVETAIALVRRGTDGVISNDPAPILAAFRTMAE
ncbi:MAG TPA: glycerophosphodiester phosphodiesterase [Spirochaetia bacterium]|nr:glycerophosphodiester phosphodiesterase [Spirochaetia bacterium]